MTQVGIIVVETGLGWYNLALIHLCGHAVLRTLQFLRAPSRLHDYHRVHAAAGGQLAKSGEAFHLVPDYLRVWLFRYASEFGFYDQLIDRFVTSPVMRASRWLASFEPGQRPRVSETAKPGGPGGRVMAHVAQEAD
jgi:NAD(P)H-quinone oxidoreductase subunit 5